MDVVGIELLKAFGRLWLHPLTYLFLLAALWFGLKRIKRERKDFHTRVYDGIHELTFPLVVGLSAALIFSIFIAVAGIEVPVSMMVLLTALWLVVIPFMKVRWLSMTTVGSLALILAVYLPEGGTTYPWLNDWLLELHNMNHTGFAWLLSVLFIAEAVIILIQGWKNTSPKLISSKRGKIVGTHEVRRMWPFPLLLLLPIGPITFDGWWPLFSGVGNVGYGLMFVPFVLGFQATVHSELPTPVIKKFGKRLLILAALLIAVSGAATYWSVLVPAVAVLGLAGKELLYFLFHSAQKHQASIYTNKEQGLLVLGVLPHSTAEKMEIEVGEMIMKVNGWEIYSQRDLYEALQKNSAFCKLEVMDRNGELRFAQSSIFQGDHHQIGLLFVPDDEDSINLSARGLRSSVVVHKDRNGGHTAVEEEQTSVLHNEKEAGRTETLSDESADSQMQNDTSVDEDGFTGSPENRRIFNVLKKREEEQYKSAEANADEPLYSVDENSGIAAEAIVPADLAEAAGAEQEAESDSDAAVTIEEKVVKETPVQEEVSSGISAFYEDFRKAHKTQKKWRTLTPDNQEQEQKQDKE
ncbi:hypothetical protein SAMN05421736_11073 [Evansella caseinilytica]|uniref:PDZ domain-containing protein n=1 Tax=Evansella caseinilytica TaxID=1503961 RepID=A0A1H3S9U6_9BACI|nr:PDZ domain-containing protein [Evansella caseinilytica]SDZ34281.1 hypothetical protein SAMN05421736_11073 [Evansella caseinilytica]